MELPQLDEVDLAIAKLSKMCDTISAEMVSIDRSFGRILAAPLLADRDSPALDVSAMDGYAIRLTDWTQLADHGNPIQVCGIAGAGKPPMQLETNKAIQIFTGGCVPHGADCVVRREDTLESPREFSLKVPFTKLVFGQNIRRRGENSTAGQVVLPSGTELTTASIGTLASFGEKNISVRRELRVSILNTGDEIYEPGEAVQDWQIRNSNGPTLQSWLSQLRWAKVVLYAQVKDDLSSSQQALQQALDVSDAVLLTGGVSAGDTDFIPQAIESLGGEIAFHGLPIRPGRPVLGARCRNKTIFGLPGNPVSAAVTARVVAQPVMETMAGRLQRPNMQLRLIEPDEKRLSLVWYRLIRLAEEGCRLVESKGSGDYVAMAQSDGFVQIPAGMAGSGPWRAWLW